jgi:hypothetical protein
LVGSRIRIPMTSWMFVSCVRGMLCMQRPQRGADHSYRGVIPCVRVCLIYVRVCISV